MTVYSVQYSVRLHACRATRPPAIAGREDHHVLLLIFILFRFLHCLISGITRPLVTKLCHMFEVTKIYTSSPEIYGLVYFGPQTDKNGTVVLTHP